VTSISSALRIIGIGNDFRGDDGVGVFVARQLRGQLPPGVSVLEETGEGGALLEAWKGAASVILIDAVRSGADPGTFYRLDVLAERLPSEFFPQSSHAFGVAEAVELARALNQLPPRLVLYGIEGDSFAAGVGLSPTVAQSAAKVAAELLAEVRCGTQERAHS